MCSSEDCARASHDCAQAKHDCLMSEDWPRANWVVTASSESLLHRASCGFWRAAAAGALQSWMSVGLGRVMSDMPSDQRCKRSARPMKEIDRWLFHSGARRHGRLIASQMKIQQLLGLGAIKGPALGAMEQNCATCWDKHKGLQHTSKLRSCLRSFKEWYERAFELRLSWFSFVCSFLHLCVCSYCICALVCCFCLPYSCSCFWSYYVRCERLQLVKIPHKRDHTIRKITVVLKFDL
jgi:hypothetical protein